MPGAIRPGAIYRRGGVTFSVVYTFSQFSPVGYPTAGKGRSIYGVAAQSNEPDTLYELEPKGASYALARSYLFKGGYYDAFEVNRGLVIDDEGAVYGTSQEGGDVRYCTPPDGCGVVFKLTPSPKGYASAVLYRFQGGDDGSTPQGGLVADATGALYGTTAYGGTSPVCGFGCGTVFKLTPSSGGYAETILYNFQGGGDGESPATTLALDANGVLYGTANGGEYGAGVAFKLTPTGSGYVESTIYVFKGATDGSDPNGPVVVDNAGVVYGTTAYGGDLGCPFDSEGCGVVFSLTPSVNRYRQRTLHAFQGEPDGEFPQTLTAAKRTEYGSTAYGGDSACFDGCGTIYSVKAGRNSYSLVYEFPAATIFLPYAGLITQDNGRKLFGEAFANDENHNQVLFEVSR